MSALEGKAEELSSCQPGSRILAWYSDDDMWHERIIIWKGQAEHGWYVVTPDLDLYEEDYGLTGMDGPRSRACTLEGEVKDYVDRVLDDGRWLAACSCASRPA